MTTTATPPAPPTVCRVDYLGRCVAVYPGVFGQLLEKLCTVTRMKSVQEGYKTTFQQEQLPLFWYVDRPEGQVFCAFAGFGPSIEQVLRDRGLPLEVNERVADGMEEPNLFPVKYVQWREGQKEVFLNLLACRRGVIVCPTAFGKTFMIKQLAKVYPKAQIAITLPQKDVCETIFRDLQAELGRDVGMLGGGQNQPGRVTVVVSKSLHKLPKDINLLLVDECHSLMTDLYIAQLNKFTRARMFGLTASDSGRSDKADRLIEAVFGPVLVDVSYQQGVAGGNIVPLEVRMYDQPEGPDVAGRNMQPAQVNRLGIWTNRARNDRLMRVVRSIEQEIGADEQVLIMVDTVEHAYLLGQLLPEYVVVSGDTDAARISKLMARGGIKSTQVICTPDLRRQYREQFEQHILKRAIATKIWKQGVDFRDLAVLVRADGSASGIDAVQIPGRLSRLGNKTDKERGILIDFKDTFSRNLLGRSMARMRVYRDKGWQIKEGLRA